MDCTVIIPSRDRPECIPKSATSALLALAQSGASGQIVIVDDGDRFPVQPFLQGFDATKLVICKNTGPKGPSAARNCGAAQSQGNLLFFLDDDDLMEPDYIQRILTRRASKACGAKWGFSQVRKSKATSGLPAQPSLLGAEIPLGKRLCGLGTGFWIERAVFNALGGLDPDLCINEDTDLCLSLAGQGLLPWYEPQSGVRLDAARPLQGNDRPSTTKSSRPQQRAAAWAYILQKHHQILEHHPVERGMQTARLAKFQARSGNVWGAFHLSCKQRGMLRLQALIQTLSGALSQGR